MLLTKRRQRRRRRRKSGRSGSQRKSYRWKPSRRYNCSLSFFFFSSFPPPLFICGEISLIAHKNRTNMYSLCATVAAALLRSARWLHTASSFDPFRSCPPQKPRPRILARERVTLEYTRSEMDLPPSVSLFENTDGCFGGLFFRALQLGAAQKAKDEAVALIKKAGPSKTKKKEKPVVNNVAGGRIKAYTTEAQERAAIVAADAEHEERKLHMASAPKVIRRYDRAHSHWGRDLQLFCTRSRRCWRISHPFLQHRLRSRMPTCSAKLVTYNACIMNKIGCHSCSPQPPSPSFSLCDDVFLAHPPSFSHPRSCTPSPTHTHTHVPPRCCQPAVRFAVRR